jgi:hypothetical protein
MYFKKARARKGQYLKRIEGTLTQLVLESTSYLILLASKTTFTEWHAKPLRAPTLICLPGCVILSCSKVEILRLEFCKSDESLNDKLPTSGDL